MIDINIAKINIGTSPKALANVSNQAALSGLKKNSIISGVIKARTSNSGFIILTDFGEIPVDLDGDFSIGEKLKFNVLDFKNNVLSLKLIEDTVEEKTFNNLSPSRDILFFSKKDTVSSLLKLFKSISAKELKNTRPEIKDIFDLLQRPEKISGDSLKKAVKFIFGSSSKEFKNEIGKILDDSHIKDLLLGNLSDTGKKRHISEEKNSDILKLFEQHKDLSIMKFAESSKFYFFIPFTDNFMNKAEFFYDSSENFGEKNKDGAKRAVIKLDMSFLGIMLIDMILFKEKKLKIDFFVETDQTVEVLKGGFDFLYGKLKALGFLDIGLGIRVDNTETLNEPLVKSLFDEESFNFNIVV